MPAVRDLRLSTVGGIWAPLAVGIVAPVGICSRG